MHPSPTDYERPTTNRPETYKWQLVSPFFSR